MASHGSWPAWRESGGTVPVLLFDEPATFTPGATGVAVAKLAQMELATVVLNVQ